MPVVETTGGFDAITVYQIGDAVEPTPGPTREPPEYVELGCAVDAENDRVRRTRTPVMHTHVENNKV